MQYAGIFAVSMILGSYILGARGVLSFDSKAYNIVQVIAGVVSVVVMYHANQLPYVLLNIAWAIVGMVKLYSLKGE